MASLDGCCPARRLLPVVPTRRRPRPRHRRRGAERTGHSSPLRPSRRGGRGAAAPQGSLARLPGHDGRAAVACVTRGADGRA